MGKKAAQLVPLVLASAKSEDDDLKELVLQVSNSLPLGLY
jgi:hypothetical protein